VVPCLSCNARCHRLCVSRNDGKLMRELWEFDWRNFRWRKTYFDRIHYLQERLDSTSVSTNFLAFNAHSFQTLSLFFLLQKISMVWFNESVSINCGFWVFTGCYSPSNDVSNFSLLKLYFSPSSHTYTRVIWIFSFLFRHCNDFYGCEIHINKILNYAQPFLHTVLKKCFW
jgi:hypothetical protein